MPEPSPVPAARPSGVVRTEPATFEVVKNSLYAAAEEMKVVLAKTAYSPLLKVAGDYSCGIFDVHGEMVAQGPDLPIHLGSMPLAVKAIIQAWKTFRPGDVFIHNDPYFGGSHLPDVNVATPAFHEGTLLGFACVRAHWPDIGSGTPGSYGAATNIYGEGLRLPPVRLYAAGELNRDVHDLIFANVRTPDERRGDMRAQIAANHRAGVRLGELARKHGVERLMRIMQEVMDYSEAMMRAALAALPDGTGRFEDFCDGDGILEEGDKEDQPFWVRMRVDKRGDRMTVDFEGTDPQVAGPMNAPLAVTASGIYTGVKMVVDPDNHIPPNSGCWRPIAVQAPPGTVVNALAPAPVVYANHEMSHRVCDMLFGALAGLLPDRVMACSQGTSAILTLGGIDPRTREPYVSYETIKGGFGARPRKDGINGVSSGISNTMNTPIEILEASFPVRVERYEITPDSGGPGPPPGRMRGGPVLAHPRQPGHGGRVHGAHEVGAVRSPRRARGRRRPRRPDPARRDRDRALQQGLADGAAGQPGVAPHPGLRGLWAAGRARPRARARGRAGRLRLPRRGRHDLRRPRPRLTPARPRPSRIVRGRPRGPARGVAARPEPAKEAGRTLTHGPPRARTENRHARHHRHDQGEARDGQGVRGRRPGAGGQGQCRRARVHALRAPSCGHPGHLRLHGALPRPGRRRRPPRHRALQDARPQDGRVHGRPPRGAPPPGSRVAAGRGLMSGGTPAMRFGFYLPTRGPTATPEALEAIVRRGEGLGFHSAVIADHIAFPTRIASRYPYSVSGEFPGQGDALEQLALMAFVAGKTERLRLVTSVMILPYRNPVTTAKTLATIDVLSGGRVTVGVGVGWLREEFEALAAPDFKQRGAVSDEYLRIFKTLWTTSPASFAGEFYRFDSLRCEPLPVQKPHPPIWVGGHSRPPSGARPRTATGGTPSARTPRCPCARTSCAPSWTSSGA